MTVTSVLISICWLASAAPAVERTLAEADAAWVKRGSPAQLHEAERLLDEAAVRDPDHPDVLWRKARLLIWKGEQTQDSDEKAAFGMAAFGIASRASDLAPSRVEGHYYAALGMPWPRYDADAAHRHLAEALEIDPGRSRTRWYLAELLVREGQTDRARALLRGLISTEGGSDPAEDAYISARAKQTLASIEGN